MSRRKLRAELAVPTTRQEDMRHPSHVWSDPEFAQESLEKLVTEYTHHLQGRSQPVSPETIDKYRKALLSMMRSMERQQLPLTLECGSPRTLSQPEGFSPETLSQAIASVIEPDRQGD